MRLDGGGIFGDLMAESHVVLLVEVEAGAVGAAGDTEAGAGGGAFEGLRRRLDVARSAEMVHRDDVPRRGD